ncbi:uncharacterized protein LOC126848023, partial [Adelges cooleyi]|uniref:uncharacterized protein LOC126848023 n=1 Tax=Adelges cooleyi TaxID=133065 RepID=UPI0021801CE3
MKSNTSLVLFAMFLCSLNVQISCTDGEPSDVNPREPTSVRNLRMRLHAFSFESFLPEEIRNDEEKMYALGSQSLDAGLDARQFIIIGKVDQGYALIFNAIRAVSIGNEKIHVT